MHPVRSEDFDKGNSQFCSPFVAGKQLYHFSAFIELLGQVSAAATSDAILQ